MSANNAATATEIVDDGYSDTRYVRTLCRVDMYMHNDSCMVQILKSSALNLQRPTDPYAYLTYIKVYAVKTWHVEISLIYKKIERNNEKWKMREEKGKYLIFFI